MPALERALTRLETALGHEYDRANQIELGILGERIVAQARTSDETMVGSDAAELKTFAAALTVFLERFPDWKAYRDDDTAPIPAPPTLEILEGIDAVVGDLVGRDEIDPSIPGNLRQQNQDVRDEPENRRLLRGFLDSTNNVLGKLAEAALATGRWVVGEAKDIGGRTWNSLKSKGATSMAGLTVRGLLSIGLKARDFFQKNALSLDKLAAEYPQAFAWLSKLMELIGL